jgi:hypothetical protein
MNNELETGARSLGIYGKLDECKTAMAFYLEIYKKRETH